MNDAHYMSLALNLAEQGRFSVSPNPMVGCVIVKNNKIIGQGYHQRAGEPHAEILALRDAGDAAKGATAYVTLEPCCHQGRTPPCRNALLSAGIKKIYVASIDPNPLVAGKGIHLLRAAGIDVEAGLLEKKAKQLNEIFFHYIIHKRPFVIAKWAMSLDGKTCVNTLDSKQISGIKANAHTHQLRREVDAILVGANTLCEDDPELTARSADGNVIKHLTKIILAGKNRIPHHLNVFKNTSFGKTIIATSNEKHKEWFAPLLSEKIELLMLPKNKNGYPSLTVLLDELGKKEITSILVEGGMTTHQHFFAENLVNKIHVYLSPILIGTLQKKRPLIFSDAS